jgi:hypothetical protein
MLMFHAAQLLIDFGLLAAVLSRYLQYKVNYYLFVVGAIISISSLDI